MNDLIDENVRTPAQARQLSGERNITMFNRHPVTFNPYPNYNSPEWQKSHAPYVPCLGPDGRPVRDISVFKGRPKNWPKPGFGNYSILGLDENICFERETRMGQYGYYQVTDEKGAPIDWDKVDWGELQHQCLEKNRARFNLTGPANNYVLKVEEDPEGYETAINDPESVMSMVRPFWRLLHPSSKVSKEDQEPSRDTIIEPRTALLLRSYSGKNYNDNDKQVIRALITELSLRSGGEYEIFLFVHVKENDQNIWESEEAYLKALDQHVPREFKSITILWNEDMVNRMYPKLTPKARRVHAGQFLPVQVFMQEFREFDFVWNWEMDSRVVGHHYDVLSKLAEFARKQPRRGLWERNERFYIPSVHGDYDTEFRESVERAVGGTHKTIWGAPNVPVVEPMGPKPPVERPEDDNYQWGVGEEADLITLGPIFDPVNSNWVLRNQVWGYRSLSFPWGKLPRRATIITQVRASRKLLDLMFVEDLRGNHLASEMVTETTAFLHGLKAVYAPMPVFFDRTWSGKQLAKWFNGGPGGQSGSFGSAFGWGQEGRFMGATWYYRAIPPQRLYNNWMGYEDTGIGGSEWEEKHGRPCLPTMLLHPIKDVEPTPKGFVTESKLPYD